MQHINNGSMKQNIILKQVSYSLTQSLDFGIVRQRQTSLMEALFVL